MNKFNLNLSSRRLAGLAGVAVCASVMVGLAGCQPAVANSSSATEPIKTYSTNDVVAQNTEAENNTAPGQNTSPGQNNAPAGGANAAPGAGEGPKSTNELEMPTNKPPKDGEEVAVIETKFGKIIAKFRSDKAPKTVENFKKLANKGFYNGTTFHRVIPGFMIQGGCPNTKPGAKGMPGTGDPGYKLKNEFNNLHHGPGVLSMARSSDPDSAGSQFFVCVADADSLDRQYTAFGEVVRGQEVADQIVAQPRDSSDMPNERVEMKVKIVKWPVK